MIGKNNVLNIRNTNARWKGKTGSTCGFCDFDCVESCIRVGLYLLERTYYNRNIKSIHDIINTFAPPLDGNDTKVYLKYVCKSAEIHPSVVFKHLMFGIKYKVFRAMAKIETGFNLPYEVFIKVYISFKDEK